MVTTYVLFTIEYFVADAHGRTVGKHYVEVPMIGDGVGGVLFEESLAGIEAVDVARVGEGPVEVFGLPGEE